VNDNMMDIATNASPNWSAALGVILPLGRGRCLVRFITASMSLSI